MRKSACASLFLLAAGAAYALGGVIRPESGPIEARPGESIRVLWVVEGVDTPLFGYSLGLERLSVDPGSPNPAVGNVLIDLGATNFYEPRNLITAAGGDLDEIFTLIAPFGSGGVFMSTNTADFSAVLPVPGVNDVLAEVVFEIGADAMGEFRFGLHPISALSDAAGFPVGFEWSPLSILVVPTPTAGACMAAAWAWSGIRRRR